ncbi:MAG: hypothetical protein JW795_06285 [Chitinivibrionales bacterium]|nr:hypothetical protein [Chitinivibrionales bacterium]
MNDSGVFQLNFQDERYLPFEGTGVVSTWRLELNGLANAFNVATLSDVIIKMEYSALQGGDSFASEVKKLVKKKEKDSNKPLIAAKMFNLAEDFSSEWNCFMANPAQGMFFKVTREMLENLGKSSKIATIYMVYKLSKNGVSNIGDTSMDLNGKEIRPVTLAEIKMSIPINGVQWNLKPVSNVEQFVQDNISNIALVCFYEMKTEY